MEPTIKNKNIISISEMLNEKERMLKLLTVKPTISEKENTINGIRFIFDSDIELSKIFMITFTNFQIQMKLMMILTVYI